MKILNYIIFINLFLIKFIYGEPDPEYENECPKNVAKFSNIKYRNTHNPYGLTVNNNGSLKNVYSFIERKIRRPKRLSKQSNTPVPKSVNNDEKVSDETKTEVKRSPRFNINRKNRRIGNNKKINSRRSTSSRARRGKPNNSSNRNSGRSRRTRVSRNKKVPDETPNEDVEESNVKNEVPQPYHPPTQEYRRENSNPELKEFGIRTADKITDNSILLATGFVNDLIKRRQQNNPSSQEKKSPTSDEMSELDKAVLSDDKSENTEYNYDDSKMNGKLNDKKSGYDNYNRNADRILGNTKEAMSTEDDDQEEDNNLDFEDESDEKPESPTEELNKSEKKHSLKKEQMADEDDNDDVLSELLKPKTNEKARKSSGTRSKDNLGKNRKNVRNHKKDIEDEDYSEDEDEAGSHRKESHSYDEDEEEEDGSYEKVKNDDEQEYENNGSSYERDGNQTDEFEYDHDDNENAHGLEEKEAEEDDEKEYTKRFKTPSGLEYLGAGYDLIKGNPLGDNITLLDPGYKSSVIQMHWNKNIENISNSLQFLQPVGGWIRPYSSCHKVETVTEINSSDSILKSLSADASVSFSIPGDSFKFAASAKYKKLDDASKSGKSKMFINKSYCFKYVAGISTSLPWDFTLGFQATLDRLSDTFKGLEHESLCKPYIYREDPNNEHCDEMGITDWMELFNTFGTHVATKIYLGGKIFTTMEVKRNQEKKLTDQGMDVKALLSTQIKNVDIDSNVQVSVIKSNNSHENLLDTKKSTFVLGGDIYGHGKTMNFIEWSKSVSDHPMPIKAEFTPISHFMDKSLHEAYKNAYLYYGKVILESDFLRYQTQIELTPEDFVNEIDIEHTSGSGNINLKCKDAKQIQFGFIITTLKDNKHEIIECPVHKNECSSPTNDEIIHSAIWIGCRSQNIIMLKQIVTKDKEPSCDKGYNILLGSSFFDSKSNYLLMKPCKLGEITCEIEPDLDYTWLVCTKKFWQLNSKTKVVKKSKSSTINCTPGETIAFGLSFEWTKNADLTTVLSIYPCKKDEHECTHTCTKPCNRIVQYVVCK